MISLLFEKQEELYVPPSLASMLVYANSNPSLAKRQPLTSLASSRQTWDLSTANFETHHLAVVDALKDKDLEGLAKEQGRGVGRNLEKGDRMNEVVLRKREKKFRPETTPTIRKLHSWY